MGAGGYFTLGKNSVDIKKKMLDLELNKLNIPYEHYYINENHVPILHFIFYIPYEQLVILQLKENIEEKITRIIDQFVPLTIPYKIKFKNSSHKN